MGNKRALLRVVIVMGTLLGLVLACSSGSEAEAGPDSLAELPEPAFVLFYTDN